jgi:hypothetical protein
MDDFLVQEPQKKTQPFQLLVSSYNNPLIGLHFRAVETWLSAERDRGIAHLVKQKEPFHQASP